MMKIFLRNLVDGKIWEAEGLDFLPTHETFIHNEGVCYSIRNINLMCKEELYYVINIYPHCIDKLKTNFITGVAFDENEIFRKALEKYKKDGE